MLWYIVQSQPGRTETYCQMDGGRWWATCSTALLQPVPPSAAMLTGACCERIFKSTCGSEPDLGDHLGFTLPLLGHHPSDLELVDDNHSRTSVSSPICSPTLTATRGFCSLARELCICCVWCILFGNWSRGCSWQNLLKVSWTGCSGTKSNTFLGQTCPASASFYTKQPAR